MLLTKTLTSFLQANLSPQVHTLFIATPSGKILASSSSLSAGVLRSQATLASTLWSLYRPLSSEGAFSAILPAQINDEEQSTQDPGVSSILIQLENGTMLIRCLKSALLFIAIGPSSALPPRSPRASNCALPSNQSFSVEHHTAPLARDLSHLTVEATVSRPTSSHASSMRDSGLEDRLHSPALRSREYATSDAGSTTTVNGSGTSFRRMKRRVEELASWLDTELGSFKLGGSL